MYGFVLLSCIVIVTTSFCRHHHLHGHHHRPCSLFNPHPIVFGQTLFHLRTPLPLDRICAELKGMGHSLDVSLSAGRFICNFLYFHSLHQCTTSGACCLFVHVPLFDKISMVDQMKLIKDLLLAITPCLDV
jgi:hypothetical protein